MGANGVANMLDLSTGHMPYNPDQQTRYEVVHDGDRPYIYDRLNREDSERWLDAAACTRRCEELNQEFGKRFWGDLRVAVHEHGWVVFVPGELEEDEFANTVPEWAQPLMRRALAHDCIFVNFDADGDEFEGLPTWAW